MRLRCACGRWMEVPTTPAVADRVDVRAHRCPSCGGTVATDQAVCPYCRSALLTRPCPRCFVGNFVDAVHCAGCGERLRSALEATSDASQACPRCEGRPPLREVARDDLTAYLCDHCSGAFLPHEDLDALRGGRAEWPLRASPGGRQFHEGAVRYLRCPFCTVLMQRRGVGRTGVVVDECRDHGVWFDVGELAGVLRQTRVALPRPEPLVAPPPPPPPSPAWGADDARLVDRLVRLVLGRLDDRE